MGSELLRNCYLNMLNKCGLIKHGGSVRLTKLLLMFKEHYTEAVLKMLQCDFDSQEKVNNWPNHLLKDTERAQHPIRHLLLIRLLGYTPELFLKECQDNKPFTALIKAMPFGDGPWPCLNPVCANYRKFHITECRIINRYGKGIVGIFSCACGFVYARKLPSTSSDDVFRKDYVKTYGHVWDSTLQSLWLKFSISLNEIAHQLGISTGGVKSNAARLNLPFRRGNRLIARRPVRHRHRKNFKRLDTRKTLRQHYRKRFLDLRKMHPNATRSNFRLQLFPAGYWWLNDNDKDWLQAHLPLAKRWLGKGKTVDREGLDIKFAEEVRRIAALLKSEHRYLKRVTRGGIASNIAKLGTTLKHKHLDKFPLASKALDESVETRFDFALRRLKFAALQYQQEQIAPSLSSLLKRAGICSDLRRLPEIKDALESVWLKLQKDLERVVVEAT